MSAIDPTSLVERRVRELGFRMTDQRRLILDAIARSGKHATFDEIFGEVRKVSPEVNRTTVYRTLETFSRYRLIHGNELSGERVYEVVAEDSHHHLICHRCWADKEIEEEAFQQFQKKMDKHYNFLVLAEHNIFMGLCQDCREEHGDTLGRFPEHPKFNSKGS